MTRTYEEALADEGLPRVVFEPAEGATLGYLDPVEEGRDGQRVAVRYARGTPEERAEAAQAQAADAAHRARMAMTISPFQARGALLAAGLLEQVEALMADPQTPEIARLAWQHAQEFRRSSPTIAAMAAALGLSDEQVDTLFAAAQGIEA